MKLFTLLLLSGVSTAGIGFAQKANIPAPQKSQFILEYNLPFIFSKTNAQRLNQSGTARQIYGELIERNNNFESEIDISRSGIDHNYKAFMHTVNTDSLAYTVKLIAISNEADFKKTLGIDKYTSSKIIPHGIIYTLEYKEKVFIASNKEFAIIASNSRSYNAFDDSARAARWGMEDEYGDNLSYDYSYSEEAAATTTEVYEDEDEDDYAVAVDSAATAAVDVAVQDTYYNQNAAEAAAKAAARAAAVEAADYAVKHAVKEEVKIIPVPSTNTKANTHYEKVPPPPPPPKIVEVEPETGYGETEDYPVPMVAVTVDGEDESDNYNDDYNDDYQIRRNKKDSILGIWTENYIVSLLEENKDTYVQLQQLKDFKSTKTNTAASFFMLNIDASELGSMARMYLSVFPTNMTESVERFNSWTRFDLNFENQDINVSVEARTSPQLTKSSKRIYRRRLNCKFKKYIDSKNDIGVAAVKVNTKNYLEELPKIVKESFANIGYFSEEVEVMADLWAITIDEKAIGKLIWGDAAFVFTDLKEKTYKTTKYDYNEETFESTEREIDKTEKLPNFLFMFTTKNTKMMTKILNLGVKKGVFEMKDGVYTSMSKYSMEPFSYYCTIKNGIVFMATDMDEIQQIKAGKRRGKLSAHDKKLIQRNSTAGWFIPSRMEGIYSSLEEDGGLNKIRIKNILNSVERMEFKTGKIRNNKMTGSVNLHTPKANGNTLDYLLLLIEDMKNL